MSYTSRIFQAMNHGQLYDPPTLSAITHIDEKDVGQVLHELVKGGVIECVNHERFRKNRKYSTKQKRLI